MMSKFMAERASEAEGGKNLDVVFQEDPICVVTIARQVGADKSITPRVITPGSIT